MWIYTHSNIKQSTQARLATMLVGAQVVHMTDTRAGRAPPTRSCWIHPCFFVKKSLVLGVESYYKSNQIKYIFATKNNNIENIQGIIKSKEAQKKPKGL